MLAATLTCGLMTLTSCQGLVDAVFGEDAQPAESSKPSTEPTKFDAKTTPLTLEALVANTIVKIDLMDGLELTSVEYSTDGTTWTALSSDPQEIKLAAVGDKVMLRGANGSYATDKDATRITCSSDGAATRGATRTVENKAKCIVYGNTRSMLKKEGFSTIDDLTDPYTFKQLFLEAGIDIDQAKALLLPDGKMSEGCFMEMFKGNTDMTNTPVLGAKTMVPKCFQKIFAGCSNVSEVVMLATEVTAGATVKDCAENWLKDTGTKCDAGPVLVVSAESKISPAELLAEATNPGTAWRLGEATDDEINIITYAIMAPEPTATEGTIEAGSKTPLVKEGTAFPGPMMYMVTNDNKKPTSTEGFSTDVPTAADYEAGTYYVWYYAKGKDDYADSEIAGPIEVTVSAAQGAQGVNAINPFEDGGDPLDTEQS